MSFFLKKGSKPGGSGGGRKRPGEDGGPWRKKKFAKKSVSEHLASKKKEDDFVEDDDEEIDSEGSDIEGRPDAGYESDPEEEKETAEQKKLRLAKAYLEEIEKEERERAKDDEDLKAAINTRLKDDELEEAGKLKRQVADTYLPPSAADVKTYRDCKTHKLSLTCCVVSPDGKFVFSASKDGGIVKWELKTGIKVAKLKGGKKGQTDIKPCHFSRVNAIAVSSDGKFLATGDDDKLVHIWDPNSLELIKTFKGHKDAVTGLAFRRKSHNLYSSSADRSVKSWNLDEMAYVETLLGHQDKITAIDAGIKERAITSGGRDSTVRIWKIVEESQLVFNGPATSTDAVKLINEDHFLTAGEDGHLAFWSTMRKKPLCTVAAAHGRDPTNGEPNWVSAVAPLPMTDLLASGSSDGVVRFWKCSGNNFKLLEPLFQVEVKGFVNSLAFSPDGKFVVAAVGQEHRLGRWWRLKEAKNSLVVIPLSKKGEKPQQEDQEMDSE